jgi:hypothetical protein
LREEEMRHIAEEAENEKCADADAIANDTTNSG